MPSIAGTIPSGAGNVQALPQPRLVKAAHEFEAQLMSELLKPLTAQGGLTEGDGDSASGGAMGEFASEALGRALSERGGLGIATSILSDLSHKGHKPISAQVTDKARGDTIIHGLK